MSDPKMAIATACEDLRYARMFERMARSQPGLASRLRECARVRREAARRVLAGTGVRVGIEVGR
jgi:hypothetical protein